MKSRSLKLALIAALAAILFVPFAGSLVHFGGPPPSFGEFPSRKGTVPIPGFVAWAFWLGVAIESVLLLFLLFPRLFGFKKAEPVPQPARAKLPGWFWWGLGMFLGCWAVYWAKVPLLDALDPYMACPLWWGFTLVLDGLVYHRTGGVSLISKKPKTVVLLALVSMVGWYLFEFLNFVVLEVWFYPDPVLTQYGSIVVFLMCFTGIFPQLFEYYQLFRTFPRFGVRYSQGPKIVISKTGYWIILLLGLAGSFFMGLSPFEGFFIIWITPALILWAVLGLSGTWTVFTPLSKGDWGPLLLTGIAMVISGLGWEFINFGSEYFFHYKPVNPVYWQYNVPYVNAVTLPFSQMPILGYLGYLPYAWICWLQWTAASKLFGFDPSLDLGPQ